MNKKKLFICRMWCNAQRFVWWFFEIISFWSWREEWKSSDRTSNVRSNGFICIWIEKCKVRSLIDKMIYRIHWTWQNQSWKMFRFDDRCLTFETRSKNERVFLFFSILFGFLTKEKTEERKWFVDKQNSDHSYRTQTVIETLWMKLAVLLLCATGIDFRSVK